MNISDSKRKPESQFIRRGMAAIEATKRDGSGIPAALVIAKLEAKLAQAEQSKGQIAKYRAI